MEIISFKERVLKELKIAAKEYSKLLGYDFDCDSTLEIKGMVRHKLASLLTIGTFFERVVICQESFSKGRVICLLATSDGEFTLGFTGGKYTLNPHTLLHKNQIDSSVGITNIKISKKSR